MAALFAVLLVATGLYETLAPPPEFQPVEVTAGAPGRELLALNVSDGRVWEIGPDELGGLDRVGTIEAPAGADYLAHGDLEGDSVAELAVAGGNDDKVTVIRQVGDGAFEGGEELAIGARVRSLVAIHGGRRDALAVGTLAGEVGLYAARDGGGLERRATFRVRALPESLASGDLDGDGRSDLVIGAADGRILTLTGTASGRFRRPAAFDANVFPRSLAVADLDGDGNGEIIVGRTDGRLSILGAGNGRVEALSAVDLGSVARSLAAPGLEGHEDANLVGAFDDELLLLAVDPAGRFEVTEEFEAEPALSATLILQALLTFALVAVAFVAAAPGPGLASLPALGLRPAVRSPWQLAAVALLLYVAAAIVLNALIEPDREDIARDLGFGRGTLANLTAGLLIIGIAPVAEEIFFRGFVFSGLRGRLSFVWAAVVSGALWGLFHLGAGGLGVVIALVIFGIVLALVYERTGSIWPTIGIHAVNNAIAFALLVG